ncbi:MAG TPA: hypothetical protein VHN18_09890 [Micromonosporaceae bacterium]|nr:hypothetical protein [Micromonosporaceae bacterium]
MKIAATLRVVLLTLTTLLCSAASAQAATVTEFSEGITLPAAPVEIAAGVDGNLWFTEYDGDAIGRITPSGVVTEFLDGISVGSGPLGITPGPDGNLWFTEYDAGRIGRITPAGVVTEFSAGISPGSSPRSIVTGADGNLWYTDTNGRRIGRITPAGVVTEFSIDTGIGGGPNAITRGSDGNVWWTEPGGIGRMTPAGTYTRFTGGYGDLLGIAAGSDGNLWVTQYFGPIRRFTSAGILTGTFTPPEGISPFGITAGPDGNLWFTDSGDDSIGRITPAGAIAIVSTGVSFGSDPRDITAGPDGNLWFTEQSLDQIGRITPSILPPVVAVTDPTAVTTTSATLSGTVDTGGVETLARFEFGPTTTYGAQTAAQFVAGAVAQPVSAALTNLQPSTTYHFRLVAEGGGGSAQSADRTFTTAPVAVQPPPGPAACSNGRDDDRDGFADGADPRCHADANPRNAASYQPQAPSEAPVDDPTLVCRSGGLALVSAERTSQGRRIRLRGVANPSQAGQRVDLYAGTRRVGTALVRANGSFSATVAARRGSAASARYHARLGANRSQTLSVQRRLAGVRLSVSGGRVVLSGRTVGRRPRSIELLGRPAGCGAFKRLATVRVSRNGSFSLSAAAFGDVDIAAYRVRIAAAGAAGARESTPPRAVMLR